MNDVYFNGIIDTFYKRHLRLKLRRTIVPYLKGVLDLYVLGDGALISKGSFMQTKHLCVLIHI